MGVAYVLPNQALTTGCRRGHVSGPPVSGWRHSRAHSAISYSKVGPSPAWTIVIGSEQTGQVRVWRRVVFGMKRPGANSLRIKGPAFASQFGAQKTIRLPIETLFPDGESQESQRARPSWDPGAA